MTYPFLCLIVLSLACLGTDFSGFVKYVGKLKHLIYVNLLLNLVNFYCSSFLFTINVFFSTCFLFFELIAGMGTEVQSKMYIPSYYSMRDVNDDASNSGWSLHHENKSLMNGQYYDLFLTRQTVEGYLGFEKEQLRQTILRHESIFRHQVLFGFCNAFSLSSLYLKLGCLKESITISISFSLDTDLELCYPMMFLDLDTNSPHLEWMIRTK